MCKKLIFTIYLILMIAMPASAYEGVIGQQGMTYYDNIAPLVDIDAQGTNPGATQTGWEKWEMPSYWSSFGPINKVFTLSTGDMVLVQMNGYKDGVGGNFGGSRQRWSPTTNGTNDFEYMLSDLAYVPMGTSGGLGMDYIEFNFFFDMDKAGKTFEFTFWNFDETFFYYPPDSHWIAYSQQNPRQWLIANGYPNGYQPDPDILPYSNMPAGLKDLTLGRVLQDGWPPHVLEFDTIYGMTYSTSFEVTLDDLGRATLYSWADLCSLQSNQYVAINGFAISIPEPTTVALLALGGLALLRKRRT